MLNGNPAFYNLPRKFKVSITGCRAWCTYPEINDIGLTAIAPSGRPVRSASRCGSGGGLSTDPHLGVRLDAFVRRTGAGGGPRDRRDLPRRPTCCGRTASARG